MADFSIVDCRIPYIELTLFRTILPNKQKRDVRISPAKEIATPRYTRLAMTSRNAPHCHSKEEAQLRPWESRFTQGSEIVVHNRDSHVGRKRPPQNDTSALSLRGRALARRGSLCAQHDSGNSCTQQRFSRRVHRTLLRMTSRNIPPCHSEEHVINRRGEHRKGVFISLISRICVIFMRQ